MKMIFTVVFLFFSSSIGAQVRPEHSGMWYNPDQDGHGLSLEVLDAEHSVGFWYRYDEDGEPEWWLLQGTNHAADAEFGPHMKLAAYRFHGMIPGVWDPATNTHEHVTDVMVEFHDCNNITVHDVWAAPAIDMIRLTHIAGLECHGPIPGPLTMAQLEGDWSVQHGQASPFTYYGTVIEPDGTYSYGGGNEMQICAYSGQITIGEEESPRLSVTYTSNFCIPGDTPFTKFGNYYEDYTFCIYDYELMKRDCESRSQVIVFPSCPEESESCLDHREIIFWRD